LIVAEIIVNLGIGPDCMTVSVVPNATVTVVVIACTKVGLRGFEG